MKRRPAEIVLLVLGGLVLVGLFMAPLWTAILSAAAMALEGNGWAAAGMLALIVAAVAWFLYDLRKDP